MSGNLQFVTGPASGGKLLTAKQQQSIQATLEGGQAVQNFVKLQNDVGTFLSSALGKDPSSWSQVPNPSNALAAPVMFFAEESSTGNKSVVTLSPDLNMNVLNGTVAPAQLDWNGQTYTVIGSLIAHLSYNQTSLWYVKLPVSILGLIPASKLLPYAKPFVSAIWQGMGKLWSSMREGCLAEGRNLGVELPNVQQQEGGDAANQPGEEENDPALDRGNLPIVGEGVSVTLQGAAATLGLVAIAAIPCLISYFSHNTYHNLLIYNLTSYDVTWQNAYLDEGILIVCPQNGLGHTSPNYDIPAQTTGQDPTTGAGTPVYFETCLGFISDTENSGVGYVLVLSFTDSNKKLVGKLAVAFDVPYLGKNSLCVQWLDLAKADGFDAKSFYEANEGKQQVITSGTITGNDLKNVSATATFDALAGKQPNPGNGQLMYMYSSMLVLQMSPA